MNTWGSSWGTSSAWGVSWGTNAAVVAPPTPGGGSKKRKQKRFFPSDEFPFDNLQVEKPLKAHAGRVFVDTEPEKLDARIEFLQEERAGLLRQIRAATRSKTLQVERMELLAKLIALRSEIDAELSKLKKRAKQAQQDEEDELMVMVALSAYFD